MKALVWLAPLVLGMSALASEERAVPEYLAGLAPEVADRLTEAYRDTARQVGELDRADARADAWGRLAMLYHAQHIPYAAEVTYGLALDEADDPRWRYLRAIVMAERGEVIDAIDDLRRVTELRPDAMAAWYRLGSAYLALGRLDLARTALDKALALEPEAAVVLAALADVAIATEQFDVALERLQQARKLAPKAGQLAYKLAMVYRRLGDMERAREWLERRGDNNTTPVIEDPLLLEVAQLSESERFYVKAGEWALERGDVAQALAAFERAVELAPDDEVAGLAYAQALARSGQVDKAVSQARRIVELAPGSSRAWYALAWLLRTGEDPRVLSEAERAARKALAIAEDEQTRTLAGALAMRQREFEQAATDYTALVVSDPEQAYYYYWLGMALIAESNCAALTAFTKAAQLRPTWGEAHLVLARVEAICGEAERAQGRATALRRARDDTDSRITAAFVALARGQVGEATRLAKAERPHRDAELLLDAIESNKTPKAPFAQTSSWWIPPEIRQ